MSLANKTEEGLIKIKCTGTEELPLDKIKEFQGALKKRTKAQKEKLLESLKTYGFSFPFFIWKNEGINWCLDGHGRLEVLNSLLNKDQLPTFPVVYVQAEDEAEAKKKLLQLNSQYGEIDMEGLKEFIDGIDIDMSEFEIPDINLDGLIKPKEEGAIPEVEEGEPICKLGDIWQLGNHRLMCGDSTLAEDVEQLMNGEKADFGFSDPPYNMNFEYNSYEDNKTESEYIEFTKKWYKNFKENTEKRAITLGTKNIEIMSVIDKPAGVACWVKKNWITSCHIAKLQQWEPIFFYGDFTKHKRYSDLYEINRKYQKDVGNDHSCPKQIELIEDIIKHYSENAVLDLFGGSGTTLIACENFNRKCYMMELDEKYCDVIIKRWENYTGEKAVKING